MRRAKHLTIATAAVANQFVTSAAMKVGDYTIANSGLPTTTGARHVTVTHTTDTGADTLGTLAVVGTDMDGGALTETITPLAGTIATGTKWFASVTSVTGAGWVINGGNDTIVVGQTAAAILDIGAGTLEFLTINTTANGAITIADSQGTIAIIKASVAEQTLDYRGTRWHDYLSVTCAAASDITVGYTRLNPTGTV